MTYTQTRADAAVKVAVALGIQCGDPVVLADGANVVVHLSPAPVVAKVAASTTEVRSAATWLQRELDVVQFLAGRGAPVIPPSPEVPATVHHGDGQVMSFWQYMSPSDGGLASEDVIGSMLRDLHGELAGYPGHPAQLRDPVEPASSAQLPVLAPLQDIPSYLARPQTAVTPAESAALTAAHARLMAGLGSFPARPLHGDAGACEQLRRLHLTVWYNLYAERLPELRPRAAELLALWPAP